MDTRVNIESTDININTLIGVDQMVATLLEYIQVKSLSMQIRSHDNGVNIIMSFTLIS